MVIHVCAWCQKNGEGKVIKEYAKTDIITHGICNDCKRIFLERNVEN